MAEQLTNLDVETIKSAIEFWQKLYQISEGKIKFEKKDGSTRIMRATLDFKRVPKEKHPKTVNIPQILKLLQQSGIMHVFDLDKQEWRSVPFKRISWLQTPDKKMYKIEPFK